MKKKKLYKQEYNYAWAKDKKKKANGWQCCGYESDEKSTEGSGRDSNSGLDSVDDPLNDLDNTHHDEKRLTAVEMKSEGEADEDLSDYERIERRKQCFASFMLTYTFCLQSRDQDFTSM